MDCTTTSTVVDTGLACPDCNRAFIINELTHQCGAMRCSQYGTSKYVEEYLNDVKVDALMIPVQCDKCDAKWHAANDPRDGVCPKCEFAGTYLPRDDGLCPACVPLAESSEPKVAPARRVRNQVASYVPVDIVTVPVKPFLYLHVPHDTTGDAIIVRGYTDESVMKGRPIFHKWVAAATSPYDDPADDGRSISEFLKQWCDDYTVRWRVPFLVACRIKRAGHAIGVDFKVEL